MRNRGELVLVAPADETEPPHHIELLRVQEMQREAPRLVNHIVTKVEFVDVDREARHRRHDRRAHRRIGNHAVLFAGSDGGNRYNWRRQIAQELVGEVRLEHTSRYMATITSLPARLVAHIQATRLFREPGEAIVAVSGGADSVALLDLLNGIVTELRLSLVVAHVDHGISSDSRMVGRSVRALAEKYGLPFELAELQLGADSSETRARRARYGWLREVQRRRGSKYIVTAHHQDDQVETIVLRALRGSAAAGLAGIAARRRGGLVRPLLPFTHAELVSYAAERGLPVYDDPANRDARHVRSWVRTTLLPLLTERLGRRLRSGWTAEVAFDRLRVGREAAIGCALERIAPSGDRGSALFGDFEIQWSPAAAPAQIERATWTTWVDSDAWEVRLPARGDSLVPLGGVGHRPLRRLLMEARVPRSARQIGRAH